MKRDEGDFLGDAPDWKLLFLPKIKIIMWSSNNFIRKSELIPEVKKKPELVNDWENISHWKRSEQTEALAKKFRLLQIQLVSVRVCVREGGGGASRNARNIVWHCEMDLI